MSNFQFFHSRFAFASALLIFACLTVSAQTTIINAPSTDTIDEKFVYIEADFLTHFGSFKNGGFRSGGYRIVYGARKNLEVGVNIFHTRSEGLSQTELQPNVKWRFFRNEKYKAAASGGVTVFIPLNRQTGKRPVTLAYSNVSKEFNLARGIRFTVGAYKVLGAEREFGSKEGAIVGVEKPIFKRVTLVADWFSGKNRFGYSAAGANFQITGKQVLSTGYNFGNTGRRNNYLSVFYGYTF